MVRRGLAGESLVVGGAGFAITRSLPHGHVAAVLAMIDRLGLARLLAGTPCLELVLVLGMVVSRVLAPASKLATSRTWGSTTLGELGDRRGG